MIYFRSLIVLLQKKNYTINKIEIIFKMNFEIVIIKFNKLVICVNL